MKKNCVDHFICTDAYNAWKAGIAGFFSRWWGFLTALFINLLGGGIFGWVTFVGRWKDAQIKALWLVIITFGLITIGLLMIFLVFRYFRKNYLELQWLLHRITHFVRDKFFEAEGISNAQREHKKFFFRDLSNQLANIIKDYFRLFVKESTIECAIRVAYKPKQIGGASILSYYTIGRSIGLNPQRERTTEPISANKGIPRYILEKGMQGALIYHDIDQAASHKLAPFGRTFLLLIYATYNLLQSLVLHRDRLGSRIKKMEIPIQLNYI